MVYVYRYQLVTLESTVFIIFLQSGVSKFALLRTVSRRNLPCFAIRSTTSSELTVCVAWIMRFKLNEN